MKKINNFIDVIKKRRSVRKFEKGKTISVESLKRIVDCGRWAPQERIHSALILLSLMIKK